MFILLMLKLGMTIVSSRAGMGLDRWWGKEDGEDEY